MFEPEDDLFQGDSLGAAPIGDSTDAQLIAELERQSIEQIRKIRAHERFSTRVRIELRPGNASTRSDFHLVGTTADISEGGCSAIFPKPVLPGDIFQLEFDKKAIDLPLVFARALRCRMLKEESFEVGFRFFTPVALKTAFNKDAGIFD